MQRLPHRAIVVMTTIAGFITALSFLVSLYALVSTPGIEDIPIYVRGELRRVEAKWFYLLNAPFVQMACFILMAWPTIKWKNYSADIEQGVAYNLKHYSWAQKSDGKIALFLVFGGVLVLELLLFFSNLSRCTSLMST